MGTLLTIIFIVYCIGVLGGSDNKKKKRTQYRNRYPRPTSYWLSRDMERGSHDAWLKRNMR